MVQQCIFALISERLRKSAAFQCNVSQQSLGHQADHSGDNLVNNSVLREQKRARTSWSSAGRRSSFEAHVERADLSQKLRMGGYPWTEGKCSGSYSCLEWPAASGPCQWVLGWQKRVKLQVTSVLKNVHMYQKYSQREIKHIFPWSVFMQRTNSIVLRMVALS